MKYNYDEKYVLKNIITNDDSINSFYPFSLDEITT